MSQIGALSIAITADGGQAVSELGKVDKSQKSLTKNIISGAGSFVKWAAAAAAAATAVAAAMTRSGLQSVDALAKTSRAIDGSINSLQALQMAAGDSGLDGLEQSLTRMNRRLGAAEFGAGAAAVTVKALGLDLEALGRMDIDQRLQTIGRAIDDAGMSSEQAARHLQNLGFEQATAGEFFRSGISDLSAYKEEIVALGLSMSEVDAAQIEQANDAMGVFGDVAKGISQQMAKQMAPVLNEISDRFLSAAMESGVFGDIVAKVFDFLVKAVARAADSISAIRRSIQTVGNYWDFMTSAMIAAWGKMWAAVMRGVDSGISFVVEGINVLIRQLNRIPKVDINEIASPELAANAADFFQNVGDAAVERMENAYDRTMDVWSQPWPGSSVESFVDNARETSRKAAEAAVDARNAIGEVRFAPVVIEDSAALNEIHSALRTAEQALEESYQEQISIVASERQKRLDVIEQYNQQEQELLAQVQEVKARGGSEEDIAALQQEREALLEQIQYYNDLELRLEEQHAAALRGIVQGDDKYSMEANETWLNGLRERNMTELELIEEQAELGRERLVESLEQELLTREEYNALMNDSEARAADARNRIAEQERKQRIGVMSSMMQNMSTLMNAGSKKMFAIGKAAAIANAMIQGKEAIVSSYAAGARIGGPYVGAAFAATAAAATMAQISQIRSSSFGGAGGGANTFSGGVPAVRTADAGAGGPVQPSQTVDINITGSGSSFSADQVRALISQINEQTGDGVNLAFNG